MNKKLILKYNPTFKLKFQVFGMILDLISRFIFKIIPIKAI